MSVKLEVYINYVKRVFFRIDSIREYEPAFDCEDEQSLVAFAESINNDYFNDYYKEAKAKEEQFLAGIKKIGFELDGKRVLDIGPGTGDSLQVAKRLGAIQTIAIDKHPLFSSLASLRGHCSYLCDYKKKDSRGRYFPIETKGVDLIWSKGAIEFFTDNNITTYAKRIEHKISSFSYEDWFNEAKSLLKNSGAFIFTPAISKQSSEIIDPDYPITTNYWVPDVNKYAQSDISRLLTNLGFERYDNIKKLNHKKAFPFTWIYHKD